MAKRKMKLATGGRRFAAALIDGIIPCIIGFAFVNSMLGIAGATYYGYYGHNDAFGYSYSTPGILGMGIGFVLGFIVLAAYLAVEIFFYSKSQSIGKAIMGLKVVSSVDGKSIGVWKMLLREFIVKKASESVFCLGYIWILIDERNRGWHDKILDTYVIDIKSTDELNRIVETDFSESNATDVPFDTHVSGEEL